MKLLPVIAAVAKAQLDLPDLSNFDLSAFGLGPGTPLNFPDAPGAPEDSERYFFTVTSTTTTTPPPTTTTLPLSGTSCWKCDAMTYATCASGGRMELCPSGDFDCCFVEIRETNQQLQQLCTGCKDETACMDNKAENFLGPFRQNHQCRPDYRLQRVGRRGPQQSVCRQCFASCDPSDDDTKCFGSIPDNTATENVMFTLLDDKDNFPWGAYYTGTNNLGFGIPTHAVVDGTQSETLKDHIEDMDDDGVSNVWFRNSADGKLEPQAGDGNRDVGVEEVYWGLQGATQAWWESNLKDIQSTLAGITGELVVANFNE
jgi:hypothetical protein